MFMWSLSEHALGVYFFAYMNVSSLLVIVAQYTCLASWYGVTLVGSTCLKSVCRLELTKWTQFAGIY